MHRHQRRSALEWLEPRLLLSRAGDLSTVARNIESNLAAAYRQATAGAGAVDGGVGGEVPAGVGDGGLLQFDAGNRVLVDVWSDGTEPVAATAARVGALGAGVINLSERFGVAEAWVELADLPAVAGAAGVLSVTPVYRPVTHAGSVTTQGDAVLNADDVRGAGVDGGGVLVGVISDSALNLAASQLTGDLPAVVDRYLELPASDEGRAMLEIVHDVAPGARLAHHTGFLSELSFADGIRRLAAAGSRVIVDDVYYFNEPFFQDGIVAQAVDEVTAAAAGVTYVTAAGNSADRGYEAAFADAGGDAGGLHDFDPSPGAADTRQQVAVPPGRRATLILQWDDPFYTTAGVTHDFDVRVYNGAGVQVAAATTNNVQTQKPLEVVQWTSSGTGVYHVEIRRTAGGGTSQLKYVLSGPDGTGIGEFATGSGTVVGHAAAARAIAVGAVPYFEPSSAAAYSARGDATIRFDAAGNRLAAPVVRAKPDVVAPDNVNTTFFGSDVAQDGDELPNFAGTSAAAPHVAAVAALVLDANPHLTRAQVFQSLTASAVDLGAAGRDRVYGFGRVDAAAAVAAAVAMADVTPPTARLLSPIATHGWAVGQVKVGFSEPLDPATATNAANYSLVAAGADGTYGTGDDTTVVLMPAYDAAAGTVTLSVAGNPARLGPGRYRLALKSAGGIADPAGNPLGGGAGAAFDFTIAAKSQVVALDGAEGAKDYAGASQLDVTPDGAATFAYPANPSIVKKWPQLRTGRHSPGGEGPGPFYTAPTDIYDSFRIQYPDVAVRAAGGVAVYSDFYFADRDYVIAYQMLGPDGRPSGSRSIAGGSIRETMPRVDMNDAGAFAIAFSDTTDAKVRQVYGRLFTAAGQPLANAFLVDESAALGTITAAAVGVGVAADGSSVFVYSMGDGDGAGIFARRFNPAGAALGPAFRVNASPAGEQTAPEVAVAGDGSFVVAWLDGGSAANAGGATAGAYVRRFTAAGAPIGDAVQFAHGPATAPQVALAPDGRFAVAWQAPDGDGDGVYLRRYAAGGSPVGTAIHATSGAAGSQTAPRLGMSGAGDMLVTWTAGDFSAQARWIAWDVPDEVVPTGPWVRGQSPAAPVSGPIDHVSVTFDRPMQAASFTPDDVTITDPVGRPVAATSVATVDNLTFTVSFPPQQLPGTYHVRVGPNVTDAAGNEMDQDGDTVKGEGADVYAGLLALRSTPASFPRVEGFEAGSVDALGGGWAFRADDGAIAVTASDGPRGTRHLRMAAGPTGGVGGAREAVLALDLSGQVGVQNLALDFWLQTVVSNISSTNRLSVAVSGDGLAWADVPGGTGLTAPVGQYTHYAFDLDAALAAAQVQADGDVYVRFAHDTFYGNSGVTLDDVRVSTADVFGPRVIGQSPAAAVPGPVPSVSVTFDEPIDASTFTAADVSVTNPVGAAVALSGNPVPTADSRTFTINFVTAQSVSGSYAVRVGPDVRDLSGNLMNQDGDGAAGEATADVYAGTIHVSSTGVVPAPFGYAEGFESGDVSLLPPHWRFATTGVGGITIDASNGPPRGGAYHLRMAQPVGGAGTREAVLVLDLTPATAAPTVELDFWVKRFGSPTTLTLSVSGDGATYKPIVGGSVTPALNTYVHYAYDLRKALSDNGIAADGDVYVKFAHASQFSSAIGIAIDDVRVGSADAFGPRVTALAPSGTITGPVDALTVTFDEPIDPASFTAVDVTLTNPAGERLLFASDPVDDDGGQHRRFRLPLEAPEGLGGTYRVRVASAVADAAGNLLNQNGNNAAGEPGALDEYAATFDLGPAAPQPVPYATGFESGDLHDLPGWRFAAEAGRIAVTGANAPRGGAFHLQMSNPAQSGPTTTREAVLALDLSSAAGATDLSLALWAKPFGQDNASLTVSVSGDGTSWTTLAGGAVTIPLNTAYRQYVFDLDAAGVPLDSDVYVKLSSQSFHNGTGLTIDDVRVTRDDAVGPRVLSHEPVAPVAGPVQSFTVTFSEPIDPATFTAADVAVTGPTGTAVALAGGPADLGDHHTFRLTLAAGQALRGEYRFRVGPDVRDPAGNLMNQDGDVAIGETNGNDAYSGAVRDMAVPQPLPILEGFDVGTLALPGWAYAAAAGTIQSTNIDVPFAGARHLRFAPGGGGPVTAREAVLALDLTPHAAATDLDLEFRLKRIGGSNNTGRLFVSGNGADWIQVGPDLLPPLNTYTAYAFDFDDVLRNAGVAPDADVYVKVVHTTTSSTDWITLDDVRVTASPVADIVDVDPDPRGAPVASMTIAFSEPVTGFGVEDLVLTRDGGPDLLPGSGAAAASTDGRVYTLSGLTGLTATPGAYVLTLNAAGSGIADGMLHPLASAAAVAEAFTVRRPGVQSVRVDDGTGQRSRVRNLTVTFDAPVALAAGAFTLAGRDGAGAGTTLAWSNPSGDGATWVLTFGGTPVVGSSLADGVYDLRVVAAAVHGGVPAGPAMAADFTFAFHRLYSDADGDGDSDNADLFQMRSTYGKFSNDPAYKAFFDYEGDGDVDNADVFQVRSRRAKEFKGY